MKPGPELEVFIYRIMSVRAGQSDDQIIATCTSRIENSCVDCCARNAVKILNSETGTIDSSPRMDIGSHNFTCTG